MTKRTPTSRAMADQLRALADRLDKHGPDVEAKAPVLAARGFPSGGSTSPAGPTQEPNPEEITEDSSTEAAALRRHEFVGIDRRYHRALTALWPLVTGLIRLIDQVLAHASAESASRAVERAGSGTCQACHRDVPGTSDDRLRAGYCSGCNMAWRRADMPDRPTFEKSRYAEVHPPTTTTSNPNAAGTFATADEGLAPTSSHREEVAAGDISAPS